MRVQNEVDGLEVLVQRLIAGQTAMQVEIEELRVGMNGLLELNQQMIMSIHRSRVSQVHNWSNPIVIDDEPSADDTIVNTAPVPIPEVHRLIPIEELAESIRDSEEGEDSEDKIWEISCEEFMGSSPEL